MHCTVFHAIQLKSDRFEPYLVTQFTTSRKYTVASGISPVKRLRLQRLVQEWQTDIHPVVDIGMIVVELLIRMANTG